MMSFSFQTLLLLTVMIAMTTGCRSSDSSKTASGVRFMTLDPGHFHAALVHKEMYDQVSPTVDVYAPLGSDIIGHLNRLVGFNARADNPTSWQIELHTSADFYERMVEERPGNVVVLSGKNNKKIDYLVGSVENGFNVLADKPWIIRSEDLPRLEQVLNNAEREGLVAYDIMTERYEITSMVQKELVNDPEVFGRPLPGSRDDPSVYMESIHHIAKIVAGAPNRRPAWFFDIREQGEAIGDVGSHLVDLTMWTLFPDEPMDYRSDAVLINARRWPTVLNQEQFNMVSGETTFPDYLQEWIDGGRLSYYCNSQLTFALRGVYIKLDVRWDYASQEHGDTHFAVYRGERSRVEVRQGFEENWRPEVYVIPSDLSLKNAVGEALQTRLEAIKDKWPGITMEERGDEFKINIPESYRVGHEFHFSQVTEQFLEYLKDPGAIPAWEKANMITKYFITSNGVDLSHRMP